MADAKARKQKERDRKAAMGIKRIEVQLSTCWHTKDAKGLSL